MANEPRRISFDDMWLAIASDLASRSHDNRCKVGAIVVTQDNMTVLGTGFNGSHTRGMNHRANPEAGTSGQSGLIHAEINCLVGPGKAIELCAKLNLGWRPGVMYMTHSPCMACASTIIQSGVIKRVVFAAEYRDRAGNYDPDPVKALEVQGVKTMYRK